MKIHHVSITINNLKESVKFYQDFLGFKIFKSFERKDMSAKAVFVRLNDFLLELWEFKNIAENQDKLDDIKIRGIRHIAFEIENIDKTAADFKQKGIAVTEPRMGASGHKIFFINDPNGIVLEFYQK